MKRAFVILVFCSILLALAPALAQSGKVASPTAFPAPGTYDHNNAVALLCATPGAKIYYTVDGDAPTVASTLFDRATTLISIGAGNRDSGQDAITARHTIRAIAFKDGMNPSDVAALEYTINRRSATTYVSRELRPGIRQIRDYSNNKFYLVKGSQKVMIIDTGLGTGNLKQYVAEFTGGLPVEVILTHLHGDHIGQADQFIADSKEYIHDLDRAEVVKKLQNSRIADDLINRQLLSIKDGDQFDLGGRRLVVYHVPGHTLGCLVVFDETDGILFAGDALGSNNPYTPDSAWMHMRTSPPPDVFLSAYEVFRSKTRGKIKEVYTGHNDNPMHERYMNNLLQAVQSYVDKGESVLVAAIRPANVMQIVVGDRLTDPEWIAVNVNKNSLSSPPDQMATLANLDLGAGKLNEFFNPGTLSYTATAAKDALTLSITPVATSTRIKGVKINGAEVKSGSPYNAKLAGGTNKFEIVVTAPDGATTKTYTLAVTR